jgi:hypothetical protein
LRCPLAVPARSGFRAHTILSVHGSDVNPFTAGPIPGQTPGAATGPRLARNTTGDRNFFPVFCVFKEVQSVCPEKRHHHTVAHNDNTLEI